MDRILVSACLLGSRVRYDGRAKTSEDTLLADWRAEGRLVSFCPEVAGGLPVPRPPAEIERGSGGNAVLDGTARVLRPDGTDVTPAFVTGAHAALATARRHGIRLAILKEGSPSCGPLKISDGTFSGHTTPEQGVTAALLTAHGIRVFNEHDIAAAATYLAQTHQKPDPSPENSTSSIPAIDG
ncbi:hypothetical protein Aple_035670 [Acrocarpospora pleiomorpha]|uniref:Uncharacterized protein n=1 Tax=Acrocarpospora pleiomorpha TaxID=90975 RepID=A0A5M3XM00_9ACTN|nr:DUF523 domain-containing protein [Acrocarpospora pleiomorpha]GES20671.1 hypothetical protein Aple_035670 [Acrocarpospora pleiomorpha]